jgi:hypothetical protein
MITTQTLPAGTVVLVNGVLVRLMHATLVEKAESHD